MGVDWPDGLDRGDQPGAPADENGRWYVDFGKLGFDVTPEMEHPTGDSQARAGVTDADGDGYGVTYTTR